jgi:hypothetical protein
MRYPLIAEFSFELLCCLLYGFQFIVFKAVEVIVIIIVWYNELLRLLVFAATLSSFLLFDKELIEYKKFFELFLPLKFPKELLRMRTSLSASPCANVILYLNPIFAENFKSFNELFVFFLSPATPMSINVLIIVPFWRF